MFLSDIPTSYLEWLLRECDLDDDFQADIEEELEFRGTRRHGSARRQTYQQEYRQSRPSPPPSGGGAATMPAELSRSVEQWYRALCLDYHPDRGGSNEAMKAINDAYGRLKKVLNL
jgi:hypothetical protein